MIDEEITTMIEPRTFFELEGHDHRELFDEDAPVWATLDRLKEYLAQYFDETVSWPFRGITGLIERPIVVHNKKLRFGDSVTVTPTGRKGRMEARLHGELLPGAAIVMPGAHLFDDRVILGEGTIVEPGALIKGPLIVGRDTEVRQGAYIRGDCLVGHGCVVGHTTEIKASIMLDGSKAGHFAYIGDSILGRDVNLGAGTKLANLKMIPGNVSIRVEGKRVDTGRRKLGAILGDNTETGCNSVTAPGTLLGPSSIVYPAIAVPSGFRPGKTYVRPGRNAVQIQSRN
jgi:carbonic anhydrase/acetyltransferase-like protein (isoleucine patch superfamily)